MFATIQASNGTRAEEAEQDEARRTNHEDHCHGNDGGSFDDIVTINVSGKCFQTYLTSLEQYPNSLLGNAERREKYRNPSTQEYFFDRHRSSFASILYYYQSGGTLACPQNTPLHIFIKELVFFDIGDAEIEQFQIDNGIKEPPEVIALPKYKPLKTAWNFLEYPDTSKPAKVFAILSVIVITASLVLFVMETIPEFSPHPVKVNGTVVRVEPSRHESWMFPLNSAIIVWFTLEFLLRLICCPNKLKFFVTPTNIIDFLSILPYYVTFLLPKSETGDSGGAVSVLRVVRVLRVLKLARHSRGLQILGNTLTSSFSELCMIGFFLFIMVLIFGSCVYYAEHRLDGTKFKSIPHAGWWAIVTMTTVGYGDLVPETMWGKLIGALTVICGVLTIALPVPVVVSKFEYFYIKEMNRKRNEEARKAQEREINPKLRSKGIKGIVLKIRGKKLSGVGVELQGTGGGEMVREGGEQSSPLNSPGKSRTVGGGKNFQVQSSLEV